MASPTPPPPSPPSPAAAQPPSASPSPSPEASLRRRQRWRRQKQDSFSTFSTPLATEPASAGTSAVTTLLYTPVAVTSFVLSLTWVDWRERRRRAAARGLGAPGWRARSQPDGEAGVVRKMHRAVARIEVADALEVRGMVAVGVLALALLVLGGAGWASWVLLGRLGWGSGLG